MNTIETLLKTKRMSGIPHNKDLNQGLLDLIAHVGLSAGMRMVEVGCHLGVSTELFALSGVEITTVDPRRGQQGRKSVKSRAVKRLADYGNVHVRQGSSPHARMEFTDASLDFVYIDGCHAAGAVVADIVLWMPKIKPGLFIGGHDYPVGKPSGVRDAVDAVLALYAPEGFQVFSDSSWVFRTRAAK